VRSIREVPARKSFRVNPIANRIAVLASGGLDSSVLLAILAHRRREVYPLYIRAGLNWEKVEIATLRRFIEALDSPQIRPPVILDLPYDDVAPRHWSVTGRDVPGYRAPTESNYIIGRNLSLIAKAAVFCAYNRIGALAMASLDANPFPDAQPRFFAAMTRAIDLGVGLKLKIQTPFLGLSKAQVIQRGRHLPLALTFSCAQPKRGLHCGECTKCAERIESFHQAGIADPTRYARMSEVRPRRAAAPARNR
jgi:7-cyano-7-deazaguanine synthase